MTILSTLKQVLGARGAVLVSASVGSESEEEEQNDQGQVQDEKGDHNPVAVWDKPHKERALDGGDDPLTPAAPPVWGPSAERQESRKASQDEIRGKPDGGPRQTPQARRQPHANHDEH